MGGVQVKSKGEESPIPCMKSPFTSIKEPPLIGTGTAILNVARISAVKQIPYWRCLDATEGI